MRHLMTRTTLTQRATVGAALALIVPLTLTACSSDEGTAASVEDIDCTPFEEYGTFDGAEVSVYSSYRDIDQELLEKSWADYAACTDTTVLYEGTGEFEAQINVRIQGGNAPDIAFFPQPGLLAKFASSGDLVEPNEKVVANVDAGWSPDWKEYGTVDGTFYAAPLLASVKSFIWYSPTTFTEAGYAVPTTWAEMIALSDQIVADGGTPWCEGIESGDATGWPATDWLEEMVLRSAGGDVYDQWVTNEIAFNDPLIVEALDEVGAILKDDDYVNGGFGDSRSIVTTAKGDVRFKLLDSSCYLTHEGSNPTWDEGTVVAEDGDVFAFYLPALDADSGNPVIGGGEFVGAFADRTEVQAFQEYLSSAHWANSRSALGGQFSANTGVDLANLDSPVAQIAAAILQDEDTTFRFDGSDIMPAAVGAGSFWKGMTDWLNGSDTQTVLDQIQSSWPAS